MAILGRAGSVAIGVLFVTAILATITFFMSFFPAPADASRVVDRAATPPPMSLPDASGVVASPIKATPAADRNWLTPQSMRSAIAAEQPNPAGSLDVPPLGAGAGVSAATGDFTPKNVSAFPQRIHGRVFLLYGEEIRSCSGTVVDSARRNVIFTAGHCVYDTEQAKFADQVAFVPGYRNGGSQYGTYYAAQWFTTQRWVDHGDYSYDIALFTLEKRIQNLGARKIAFDLKGLLGNGFNRRLEFTIFGYPAEPSPRFNGEILRGCRSALLHLDATEPRTEPYPLGAKPCDMREGSSGGGWITFNRYLSSLVSYGYCDSDPSACGIIYGPYFSSAAKRLYTDHRVGGSPAPTVKAIKAPGKVVRKRNLALRFDGKFATWPAFFYRLDGRKKVRLSGRIRLSNLSPGNHRLQVQAVDQTGKTSRKIVRKFRVVLKNNKRR